MELHMCDLAEPAECKAMRKIVSVEHDHLYLCGTPDENCDYRLQDTLKIEDS